MVVLEYFGELRRPLRAIDIVTAFDMPPSSADQLLKTLAGAGYLIFDDRTKLYRPAPRLLGFASWMNDGCFAGCDVERLIIDLRRTTGEFVSLTVQNDCEMQIVYYSATAEWEGEYVSKHLYERKVPVLGSVAGCALLSQVADCDLARIRLRTRKSALIKPYEQVVAEVRRARQNGYAAGDMTPYRNYGVRIDFPWAVGCIAMALPPAALGGTPAVIGIGGPWERLRSNELQIVDAVQRAVGQLAKSPPSAAAAASETFAPV